MFSRFFFLSLFLLLFLNSPFLLAADKAGYRLEERAYTSEKQSRDAGHEVTTHEYCEFLNATAAADPQGCYEEKMGRQATDYRLQATGSEAGVASQLITRSGEPGSYCYEVAEGKEDLVINYVGQNAAICYCDWLGYSASTLTLNFNGCEVAACDEQLRSNRLYFQQDTISVMPGLTKKNGKGDNLASSVLKDSLIFVGAIVAMEEGTNINRPTEREGVRETQSSHAATVSRMHVQGEDSLKEKAQSSAGTMTEEIRREKIASLQAMITRLEQEHVAQSHLLEQQNRVLQVQHDETASLLGKIEEEEATVATKLLTIKKEVMVMQRPDIVARAQNMLLRKRIYSASHAQELQEAQKKIAQLGKLMEKEFVTSMAVSQRVGGADTASSQQESSPRIAFRNAVIRDLGGLNTLRDTLETVKNIRTEPIPLPLQETFLPQAWMAMREIITKSLIGMEESFHKTLAERTTLFAPAHEEEEGTLKTDLPSSSSSSPMASSADVLLASKREKAFFQTLELRSLTQRNLDWVRCIHQIAKADSEVSAEGTIEGVQKLLEAYKMFVAAAKEKAGIATRYLITAGEEEALSQEILHAQIDAFSATLEQHLLFAKISAQQLIGLLKYAQHLDAVLRGFGDRTTSAEVDNTSRIFKTMMERNVLGCSGLFPTHQQSENEKKRKSVFSDDAR